MTRKIKAIKVLIVLVIFASVFAYAVNWAFFDIQRIKGEDILEQYTSPDGKYTVTAYLNNGGATTDYAVLGELKDNETNKTRNIYWNYHCESASVKWIDNTNVKINDIELDVTKDIYDYRHDLSTM